MLAIVITVIELLLIHSPTDNIGAQVLCPAQGDVLAYIFMAVAGINPMV